jgi:hypothetical protein
MGNKTIAIIDDNPDQSSTAKLNIELELEGLVSSLEVITSFPLKDPNEYFDFIDRNNVCVLILDEKLNDQSFEDHGPVDYTGSQLVTILRSRLKDFPIFALTVINTDKDLSEKFSLYEDIIGRGDFIENASKYVPKIWRAAKNYLNENDEAYSRFNELSKIVSNGSEDEILIKEFQSLQAKLELSFSGFEDRNSWLNEYENQINRLEEIRDKLNSNQ